MNEIKRRPDPREVEAAALLREFLKGVPGEMDRTFHTNLEANVARAWRMSSSDVEMMFDPLAVCTDGIVWTIAKARLASEPFEKGAAFPYVVDFPQWGEVPWVEVVVGVTGYVVWWRDAEYMRYLKPYLMPGR